MGNILIQSAERKRNEGKKKENAGKEGRQTKGGMGETKERNEMNESRKG